MPEWKRTATAGRLPRMLRLLPALLLATLLLLPASSASAACGVSSPRAFYETPEVQVHREGLRVIACYRATGEQREVGRRPNHGSVNVLKVHDRRWLEVDRSDFWNQRDHRFLFDLRTWKQVSVDEGDFEDVYGFPGMLLTNGKGGLIAHFIGRPERVLDPSGGDAVALVGRRLYWTSEGQARTARLDVSEGGKPQPPRRATRIGRCVPRPGAVLLFNNRDTMLARDGKIVRACRHYKWRVVGAVKDPVVQSYAEVTYVREGIVGRFDTWTSKRQELPGAGAAGDWFLAAGGPDGLRVWQRGRGVRTVFGQPVTEVAISQSPEDSAYFLDATGAPQRIAFGEDDS